MSGNGDSQVLGIDFGTDSVRAVLFGEDGETVATRVEHYPRWRQGLYCDPAVNRYRQHPADYIDSLVAAVSQLSPDAGNVKGIAVDTTGSTPVAVNREGVPLSLTPQFADNPNAMFILWKDHTAVNEADDINRVAHEGQHGDYTRFSGGIYSTEWFWAKMLHILRNDSDVGAAAYSWVEHCDWMTAELTGNTDPLALKRSRCAAGHKAMWHESFDGLPADEFLTAVDPLLTGMRERLYSQTYTSDAAAGTLTPDWAKRLGLSPGIPVAVGAFDAHMGAVGAGISPGSLVKVMGTSTCDMLVAPVTEFADGKLVSGICGQVDGSIIPGMVGLEAGQSAFGDVYAWFRQMLMWPVLNLVDDEELQQSLFEKMLPALSEQAEKLERTGDSLLALDWLNGRRTPDANPVLKGAVAGLTLGTDAPKFFRSLVDATAYGSRAIIDRFIAEGIRIDDVIAVGGVADQSALVMQTLANVLDMPIKVSDVEQTCALGAAMHAAVVGGLHATVEDAQAAMGGNFSRTFKPEEDAVTYYRNEYRRYQAMAANNESQASAW